MHVKTLKRPVFRRCRPDTLLYRSLHKYMGNPSPRYELREAHRPQGGGNVGNTANGDAHQIMRHNSHLTIFQDAYLNAFVRYDVQNAVLKPPMHEAALCCPTSATSATRAPALVTIRSPTRRGPTCRRRSWSPSRGGRR